MSEQSRWSLVAMSLVAVCLLAGVDAFGEEPAAPLPDRWRGLVLDESTPEDAVRVLGSPSQDEVDRLTVFYVKKWVTSRQKEKAFRVLKFKGIQGYDRVYLAFLDERLVYIRLDLDQKLPAAAIGRIYGITFTPHFDGLDVALSPWDFQHDGGRVYPKKYPETYILVATAEKSFVTGYVDNVNLTSMLGVQTLDPNAPPGKVTQVQLVSRTLENRDGADLLK